MASPPATCRWVRPTAEDFALGTCDGDGNVTFTNMPNGTFKIAVFDQWNDIMLDGLVGSIVINGDTNKEFPVTQWRANLSTHTFIDTNGDGVPSDGEPGLALVNTNIRYRDGSFGFFNNTDLNGYAGFNEVFPFMNWLVVETTSTRFKPTRHPRGLRHGRPGRRHDRAAATSTVAAHLANTLERAGTSAARQSARPGRRVLRRRGLHVLHRR